MKMRHILIFLLMILPISVSAAESASQVLDKAISNITKAKGIKASFKINGGGMSNVSGNFEGNRQKFKISVPNSITWFDGKNMWTANQSSKQITLVNPTSAEISEANPFSYLNSYKGKYKIGFSKRKEDGKYLILLNPINAKDPIKAVEIAVNAKTYLPERFIIRDRKDNRTTIYVNSLNLNYAINDGNFVCPVGKMKDYELVDLR